MVNQGNNRRKKKRKNGMKEILEGRIHFFQKNVKKEKIK